MSADTDGKTEVQHQPDQRRFAIPLGESMAILEYELSAGRVEFTHTWVPPESRGGAHASTLVREGLCWARTNRLEISTSCWYVAKYLKNET